MNIREELEMMGEAEYKNFTAKLIPNVASERIIGIRVPLLRQFAKRIAKENPVAREDFLEDLPHYYLEENHLHGFFIEAMKDVESCIAETERFLPYVDNWATCDLFSPKVFKKHPQLLREKIREWIFSEHVYMIRYGIGLLLSNYLEEHFCKEDLRMIAEIRSEEYYINMMIAWYFSMALVKQYDEMIGYLERGELDDFVHRKTIQKAIESRRISDEKKAYLKSLRR